jgi:hypothetical protein
MPSFPSAVDVLADALLDRHCIEADDAIAIIDPIMSCINHSVGA